jgi:hypothetical protein
MWQFMVQAGIFLSIGSPGILTGPASMPHTMEAVYHAVAGLRNRKQEMI